MLWIAKLATGRSGATVFSDRRLGAETLPDNLRMAARLVVQICEKQPRVTGPRWIARSLTGQHGRHAIVLAAAGRHVASDRWFDSQSMVGGSAQ